MKQPMESWPCKKSFGPAPEEEMRKDMMEGSCNMAVEVTTYKDHAREEGPQFPDSSKGGLDKFIKIYWSVCRYLHVEEKEGSTRPSPH